MQDTHEFVKPFRHCPVCGSPDWAIVLLEDRDFTEEKRLWCICPFAHEFTMHIPYELTAQLGLD